MSRRATAHGFSVVAALLLATGCGSGVGGTGITARNSPGGSGGGTPATYTGAIADSLKSGAVSLTIAASANVTGTLTFVGGPTVPVTGLFANGTDSIVTTGGGYALAGISSNGTMTGTYAGPGGTGRFVAASDSVTGVSHSTYCGLYQSTNGSGFFSAVIDANGAVHGFAVQTIGSAESATFFGNLTAGVLTAISSQAVSVTGTISADLTTITGSYAPLAGGAAGTGTYSASTGGC